MKVLRRYALPLWVVAGLLALNAVLLAIVAIQDDAPSLAQPSLPAASEAPRLAGPTPGASTTTLPLVTRLQANEDPLSRYLAATVDPLARAATDHGVAVAEVLPSEADLDAAVASGSLDSEASQRVSETLKAGYARFNMPFPEPVLRKDPAGGEPARPSGTGGAARKEILRAYFAVTRDRLTRAARAKGVDVSDCLPDEASVQAAVESGAVSSEASQKAVARLRTGYARLEMAFPEPMDGM